MKTIIVISFRVLIILTVLTGIVYPLAMTAFGYLVFPGRSQGSLVTRGGAAVGSALIGQRFTSQGYFHGRASASGNDPMASGATNMGQTNQALKDSVAARRAQFVTENSLAPGDPVPLEMLAASGSGLDPEISPEAAMKQLGRIARARKFDISRTAELAALVRRSTTGPELGFLGRPRVNVLLLNLALDEMSR